jgi:hypothetical protein
VLAIGCNIGCQRMALTSDLNVHEISLIADWYLTEETLKAASIDIINFASRIPVSRVYGRGATCSADGMRSYVPIHILAADYSHVLQGRGITLYAHTADNSANAPAAYSLPAGGDSGSGGVTDAAGRCRTLDA